MEVKGEYTRTIQILLVVEASIGFMGVFKIVKPVALGFKMTVMGDMQRGQFVIRLEADLTVTNVNIAIEQMILAGDMMIIAKGCEWIDCQCDCAINRAISDYGGVLSVNHKNLLFEEQVVKAISKNWIGIKAKVFEITIAVRMDGTKIAIAAQFKCAAAWDGEGFFKFRKDDKSAKRWVERRHEQSVITPGI